MGRLKETLRKIGYWAAGAGVMRHILTMTI